jgi:hypothetical protein
MLLRVAACSPHVYSLGSLTMRVGVYVDGYNLYYGGREP